MYRQKINYVIVGVFVTAMLSAGIISVALLTGRTAATDRYFIVLENVADVKFGTQVRYEGYPVGQVDGITPVVERAGMEFRVDVGIQQGWRIPSDSIARIGSSSFLAAKTIDIDRGDSEVAIEPGNRISSAPPIDILSAITATADELSELNRTNIKPLLQTLQSLAETVEGGTPRIMEEIMAFTEGLNSSLEPLQEILASRNVEAVQHSIQAVEEATGNLAAVSRNLTEIMPKVDNVVRTLDRLVEDNQGNVDRSLKDLQYTVSSVAATVDSIVHNLEGTARNMNEFSRLIRRNPGLLLDGTPRDAVSPARAAVTEPRQGDEQFAVIRVVEAVGDGGLGQGFGEQHGAIGHLAPQIAEDIVGHRRVRLERLEQAVQFRQPAGHGAVDLAEHRGAPPAVHDLPRRHVVGAEIDVSQAA